MNETVNQEKTTAVQPETEPKTFTQEEMDAIIGERLKRERAKYVDYESLKEKADKFDAFEEANKTELQKATERAEALQKELNAYKKADEVRELRDKVSKETGVPADLITGEDEETCRAQAEKLKAYIAPGYPNVKDGGEVRHPTSTKTRDQFADWFNAELNKK